MEYADQTPGRRARRTTTIVATAALAWCAAAPGSAAQPDDGLVCRQFARGKAPVCMPRAVMETLNQFKAELSTGITVAVALGHMAPDFCLDASQRTPPDCRRPEGSGRTACVSTPVPQPQAAAAGVQAPGAAPSLSMYLAYMAVLRMPGEDNAAAGTLLGNAASEKDPKGWGLASFEEALKEDLRRGDARAVVNDLLMLAGVFVRSGDLASAGERLADAGRRAGEGEEKAAVLANLGVVSGLQGDYAKAIEHLKKAVDSYRALHGAGAAKASDAADGCASDLTFDETRRALAVKSVRVGLELSLINLGVVHGQLGQFDQAFAYLRQALALYAPAGGRGAGAGLAAMAAVSRRANRPDDARKFIDDAAKSGPSLLLALANTYSAGVELRPGVGMFADQAIRPARNATGAAQAAAFEGRAVEAERLGRPADALAAYRQAALVAEATGASDALRATLANLQRTAQALRQTELAVYYGKRAVNEIQQQRSGLSNLSRDLRRSFAASSRPVYEALAEALFASNRLAEAEHALLLLHQDDLAEFGSARGVMPLNAAERAFQAHDAALAARWGSAARQREAVLGSVPGLRIVSPKEVDLHFDSMVELVVTSLSALAPLHELGSGLGRSPEARQASAIEGMLKPLECNGVDVDPRLGALRSKAIELRRRLAARAGAAQDGGQAEGAPAGGRPPAAPRAPIGIVELKCSQFEQAAVEDIAGRPDERLAADLRVAPGVLTPEDQALVERGRAALAVQTPGTAAAVLHYLITDRRLYVLVVTQAARAVRHVDIGREAVNGRIDRFRRAVQTPGADALAPASALHAVVIAPVAEILDREGVSLLQLALDGRLRQVPFAALHDGRGWLVERYALVSGSPSEARAPGARQPWRVAGFGATAVPGFTALPGVAEELHGMVRDEAGPSARGSMAGIVRLDRAFTARALRDALSQRYPVVHIASHFVLGSEDADASFLLLGDGTRLTLQGIRDGFRFDGVELVTLSACQTGLDASNGYGQEFEGLSAVLRSQGATSVMATLWPVADGSTSLFMRRFYAAHEQQRLSRAQALRAAQLVLIRGVSEDAPASVGKPEQETPTPDGKFEAAADARGASRPGALTAPVLAPHPSIAAPPYAHPFFWAPFVLAGDAS